MPDFRSHCDTPAPGSDAIELSAEESSHLVAVNRSRAGDLVVAFDGLGREWRTRLEKADKRRAVLRVESAMEHPAPACRIAIAQAIPKAKGLEAIARKAAEIGARDVFPIVSERTEFKLKAGREETKDAKWRQAAIEGCKQSGNPFVPETHAPVSLKDFLAGPARAFELRLVAALTPEAKPIGAQVRQRIREGERPGSAVWLVGPEGDFSPEEYRQAFDAGFLPVTLGPYVMKCETAAVAALSLLRAELD